MSRMFLINNEMEISYEKLINDLNKTLLYSTYVYEKKNDPYTLFLSIIHSLVFDYPIVLLDGSFSDEELKELKIDKKLFFKKNKIRESNHISSNEELLTKIKSCKNWRLTLYTSGTTDKPKAIIHDFERLTKFVKVNDHLSNKIWGFAYNPTHMAGLQVFFQALLNKNTMVYLFDHPFDKIAKWISEYKVTNISATPTFYRNLLPYIKEEYNMTVERITVGGEKFDTSLAAKLTQTFSQAEIRNIYATTETASLFTSEGEIFQINDEYGKWITISEENELLIHKSLLGESKTLKITDEWYHTGDLVEQIDDKQFKFISRKSEQINVGGYKVNPLEVESVLRKAPGVKDIIIKSRSSSVTGEIIVAEVVKQDNVDDKDLKRSIKKFASEQLQSWKIPRIIKIVPKIDVSRTGKQVRK